MLYYSTNHKVQPVTLKDAVIKGLASDNGLFMPERINRFEPSYFEGSTSLHFRRLPSMWPRSFLVRILTRTISGR
jgi:threonine synthase